MTLPQAGQRDADSGVSVVKEQWQLWQRGKGAGVISAKGTRLRLLAIGMALRPLRGRGAFGMDCRGEAPAYRL